MIKRGTPPNVIGYIQSKSPLTLYNHPVNQSASVQAFIDKIASHGRILQLERNVLHMQTSRFQSLCDQIKGLTLEQALLQIKWHRRQICRPMTEVITQGIVQAKESGFDLSKTFVGTFVVRAHVLADAFAQDQGAIVSQNLMKQYLRGRGRYGATPTPKTTLLHLILQEREIPFKARTEDPLEWIRDRLRDRQRPWVQTPEQIYESARKACPLKVVHA